MTTSRSARRAANPAGARGGRAVAADGATAPEAGAAAPAAGVTAPEAGAAAPAADGATAPAAAPAAAGGTRAAARGVAAHGVAAPVGERGATPSAYGYVAHGDKEALTRRMRRVEGQVRGIEKMISDDRYCIDILTQISAVTTALEAVAFKILNDHVSHCVARALSSGDEQVAAAKSQELLEAVHRFTRAR